MNKVAGRRSAERFPFSSFTVAYFTAWQDFAAC
jgi:hypothetical protein